MPHLPLWPSAAGTGGHADATSPALPKLAPLISAPSLAYLVGAAADVEMGDGGAGGSGHRTASSTSTSSGGSSDSLILSLHHPPLSPPPRALTCSMAGAGPALGTPPPGAPPATIGDLPPDVLRTILGLLEPTAAKRDLARVSSSWCAALASPASWPTVDLHPVTVSSSTWLARMLAGPGGGRVAVTVRAPADEASCVSFHDLVLAGTPPALAALTVHIPWQTSFPFSHLWWALKSQARLASLSLRGGAVDVSALPLGPGSSLAHLSIECTALANLGTLASGARHLTSLELSIWPALGGPASAAAAAAGRPGPGGRVAVEAPPALGGLDAAPLSSLTGLCALALNSHPWSPASGAALWNGGLLGMRHLTSLTLASAPGFSACLALPDRCALRLSARGALPPRAPSYSSLVALSLRDLAAPTFDAAPLTFCSRLASLDVSFAAETGCVVGLAGLTGLTSLKAGCSALRLILPPLPALRELECVAFGDLEIVMERGGAPSAADVVAASLAAARRRPGADTATTASTLGSVYLASLNFDVGVMQFVHACGRAGLDLHFATSPLRAVFTADQVEG